jgi:hypothetical protein
MAAITDAVTDTQFAIVVSDGHLTRAHGIGIAGKRWAAESNIRGMHIPDGMVMSKLISPSKELTAEFVSAFGSEPSTSSYCRSRVASHRAKLLSSSARTQRQIDMVYGGKSRSVVNCQRKVHSRNRKMFPEVAVAQRKLFQDAYVKTALFGGNPTW